MANTLPQVKCGLFIEASFDETGTPGFEMRIDVTYHNLPKAGLVGLEREVAALIDRMAAYGESTTEQ